MCSPVILLLNWHKQGGRCIILLRMNKIDIYPGWCKKCGICVAFCPRKVLETGEDSYPVASHPEKCTGCAWCEMRCPDFAIVVHGDKRAPDDSRSEPEDGISPG